jgi:hypothetical protein
MNEFQSRKGISEIEGKAARAAASERGQRTSFNPNFRNSSWSRFSSEMFPLLFRQTGVIISFVSASEIIKELPKLSEAERRAVLNKLRELAVRDEDVRLREQAGDEQAAELDRLEEPAANYGAVDLRSRGISEAQARDLRARLKTFAEDWDRPEAAVYDEDPAR